MVTVKAVFDTNILIDYLNGVAAARREIRLYESPLISPISWMEVLLGTQDAEEEQRVRNFLRRFELVPIDQRVSEEAIKIRRKKKLRLPDAIVWASAKTNGALLVTRNTKDFPQAAPDVRVPYRI